MPPKYLYKFEKMNLQTLRNLKNAEIYFNTPASFNDPFDCSIFESSLMLNDNDIVFLYNRYREDMDIRSDHKIESVNQIPPKINEKILTGFEKAIKDRQHELLYNRGCTCFTEIKDDILMWSHYADGHKGFCLEFDTSFDLFAKVKKVNYSSNFPKVKIEDIFGDVEKTSDEMMKPLLNKFDSWSYEKEWRLFHKEPNKTYGYPVEALSSVYFGLSASFTDIEIACLTLQGQSKNIKFYKANKDKSKYSVWFEEFTYTPHINIKK